jgi:tetratricopeptide (TPR) repeat protein
MPDSPAGPPPHATAVDASDAPRASAPAWWRSATLLFVTLLLGLLTFGLWGWLAPVDRPHGLPADRDVAAAQDLLTGGLPLALPDLILATTLAGESRWIPPDSLPVARLAAAHERLLRAAGRHADDPRITVSIAHLELAGLRTDRAIQHYREALDRSPHYGEARLGLGIALTAGSLVDSDPERGRVRALEALGQFANVDAADPAHAAALYNRALLLSRVGRTAEAIQLLQHELAVRPSGPWAARYQRLLAGF